MKVTKRLITMIVLALTICLFCSAYVAASSGNEQVIDKITQATKISVKSSVTNIIDSEGNYANCWFADIEAEGSDLVMYKLMDGETVLQTGICKLTGTNGTAFFGCMKFEIQSAADKTYKIVLSNIDGTVSTEARTFQILNRVSSERSVPFMNGVVSSNGFTYEAEKTFFDTAEGKDYDLSAQSTEAINITLGENKAQYFIDYVPYTDEGILTASVTYSDIDGNILGKDVYPIEESGVTTINVPASVTYNEAEYQRISGQATTILVNRTSPKTDFTVYYLPTDSNGYYNATIKFILSGTDIELMPKKTVRVSGADAVYIAPSVITQKDSVTGNTVCYRTTLEDARVTLERDSAVREYTIEYKTLDETGYSWFIRRIDASTGATIGQDIAVRVNPGETKEQALEPSFNYNGVNYSLDSAMGDKLTYSFGDSPRVSFVYYNPEGYSRGDNYEITVYCYSVTDSAYIYNYKVTTDTSSLTKVDVPATLDANGNTYVLLNGQQSSFDHNYYSPTRTYTVFYRDINDIQNEVTRVTTVDIISDIFEDGGYIFNYYSQNIVENEETGETTIIDDIETPLDDGSDNQTIDGSHGVLRVISDRAIPLAAADNKTPVGTIIMVVASGLVLIFIAVVIVTSVKRENKKRARRAK